MSRFLIAPLAWQVASSVGAKRGLLLRGGDVLERAAAVDTVVFDKTGTLTEGRLRLQTVLPAGAKSEHDAMPVLRYSICLHTFRPERSETPSHHRDLVTDHSGGIQRCCRTSLRTYVLTPCVCRWRDRGGGATRGGGS